MLEPITARALYYAERGVDDPMFVYGDGRRGWLIRRDLLAVEFPAFVIQIPSDVEPVQSDPRRVSRDVGRVSLGFEWSPEILDAFIVKSNTFNLKLEKFLEKRFSFKL